MTAQIIHLPLMPRVVRIVKGIERHEQINRAVDKECYTDVFKMAKEIREKGL